MTAERSPSGGEILVWGILVAFVAAGTYFMAGTWFGGEVRANVSWPGELNWSRGTTLPVVVTDEVARPVEDARVEIGIVSSRDQGEGAVAADVLERRWRRVSSETTGPEGRVQFELPPTEELLPGPDRGPEKLSLVVRAGTGWTSTLKGMRYPVPPPARIALQFDRDRYRPGGRLRLRGVVFESDGSGPIGSGDSGDRSTAVVTVVEPGGHTIYRQRHEIGEHGVVSADVSLAEGCLEGRYRIRLSHRGAEKSRTVAVRASRSVSLEVDAAASVDESSESATRGSGEAKKGDGERGGEREEPSAAAPSVEVLPVGAPHFRVGEEREAVVTLRDDAGEPVAGADVILRGDSTERSTTGGDGRAQITWSAPGPPARERGEEPTIRHHRELVKRTAFPLDIETQGERRSLEVPVSVVPGDAALVVPENATPVAGSSVSFDVDVAEKRDEGRERFPVVAVHDGSIVGRSVVEIDGVDGEGAGEIALGLEARGLTHLIALDRFGAPAGRASLWVRQRASSRLEIKSGEDSQRRGNRTTIAVRAPFGGGDGGADPAAFGLRGLDSDAGGVGEGPRGGVDRLPAALWHDGWSERAALRALAASKPGSSLRETDGSEARAEGMAARLARMVSGVESEGEAESEVLRLNDAAGKWLRRGWFQIWTGFLYLLFAVLAVATIRSTNRRHVAGALSWRRLGAFLLVAAVGFGIQTAVSVGFAATWVSGFVEWVVPAFAAVLVVLGAMQCQFRGPRFGFRPWVVLVFAQMVLVGILVASGAAAARTPIEIPGFGILLVAWVAIVAVEAAFWASNALEHRLNWAFLGASSLLVGMVSVLSLFVPGVLSWISGETELRVRGSSNPVVASEVVGSVKHRPEERPVSVERPALTATPQGGSPRQTLWRPAGVENASGEFRAEVSARERTAAQWVEVVAHSRDGALSRTVAHVGAERPWSVDFELPRNLRRGDHPEVPVTVTDRREEPEGAFEVVLFATAEGALAAWEPRLEVEVPAGERSTVLLPVVADGVGTGTVRIRAGAPKAPVLAGDDSHVWARGRRVVHSRSGWVSDGWSASFEVPMAAFPESLDGRVTVLSGDAPMALDLASPGGPGDVRAPQTFERVTSRLHGYYSALRTLEAVGLRNWSEGARAWRRERARAVEGVRREFQRLVPFQTEEGGFSPYIGGESEPDAYSTAVALFHLGPLSRSVDFVGAERAAKEAAQWLVERQHEDGRWPAVDRGRSDEAHGATTALATWALARLGETEISSESAIKRASNSFSVEALDEAEAEIYQRAMATNASFALGNEEVASALAEDLADRVAVEQGELRWRSRDESGARFPLTALALVRSGEDAEWVRAARRFLGAEREAVRGWGSTWANVWSTEAFRQIEPWSPDEPMSFDIVLDERSIARSENDPHLVPGRSAVKSFETSEVFPGRRRFEVAPQSGELPAVARAEVRYAVPWHSDSSGASSERFDFEFEVSPRETQRGEPIEVTVHVENASDGNVGALDVYLPLAPGGWLASRQLEVRAGDSTNGAELKGIGRTSNYLVANLERLGEGGEVIFEYTIRPRLGGAYRLPPLRISEESGAQPIDVRAGGRLDIE